MNKDFIDIFGATCGLIFFYYGLVAYFEAGISQGNYGLVALPIGLGMAIGFIIKFISRGG